MRTARSLTVSRSICHACPCHCHMPPTTHAPLCHVCPLATHAPAMHAPSPAMHTPCHACPLPCMPPTMHAPCHTCPLPHMPPRHMPPCHACPPPWTPPCHAHPLPLPCMPLPPCTPPLWTEFLTHASENITLPQHRCGRQNIVDENCQEVPMPLESVNVSTQTMYCPGSASELGNQLGNRLL